MGGHPLPAWRQAIPAIAAHRGGLGEGPENTLYGMVQGLRSGATHLEIDVRGTEDQIPVCIHDEKVDRTTGAHGLVDEMTIREVRALDPCHLWSRLRGMATGEKDPPAGFSARWFQIPTLDDVLKSFPGVPIILDLKDTAPVDSVANLLETWGRTGDVMLQGYDDDLLDAIGQRLPEAPRGAGFQGTRAFFEGETVEAAAIVVPRTYEGIEIVDQGFIDQAHEQGMGFWVWTINEERSARELFEMDVDGVVTDVPGKLHRLRRERLEGKA